MVNTATGKSEGIIKEVGCTGQVSATNLFYYSCLPCHLFANLIRVYLNEQSSRTITFVVDYYESDVITRIV